MHLPLVVEVTCSLALFHLGLVRPDHQEEVGVNQTEENAADSHPWVEVDYCPEDGENFQDKADSRQHNPWFHQTHVALRKNQVCFSDSNILYTIAKVRLTKNITSGIFMAMLP